MENTKDALGNKLPFSTNYAQELQKEFVGAVLQANFKEALAFLETMPIENDPVKRVERLITLVDGYKIIADMFYHNHKTKDRQEEIIKI